MGRTRGITINAPGNVERICSFIASLPRAEFTLKQIRAALPDIPSACIGHCLNHKIAVGWLERVSVGTYRIGGTCIRTALPSGIIAEAMWLVLATAPFAKPLRSPEIVGETESLVNRHGVRLQKQVTVNLLRWHRSGHLIRSGSRGEYAYTVRDGLDKRPPLSRFS